MLPLSLLIGGGGWVGGQIADGHGLQLRSSSITIRLTPG